MGTDDKRAAVLKIIRDRVLTQAIVFVNSKLGCARLARSFERDGLRTNALHGDKSQDERLKALAQERRRFGYRRLHVLLRREGEIVIRPKRPEVMFAGYWGRPEATVETSAEAGVVFVTPVLNAA